MADILALEKLFDDVSARFASESTNAVNVFGWKAPAHQLTSNRIAWVPGAPSGALGDDAPARNPGRNPRPIATLLEQFHVVISASDGTAPEDERAQYHATRVLRDAWQRACYLAAHGTFGIKSQQWLVDKTQRRFGAAIVAVCWIEAMVPDAVVPVPDDAIVDGQPNTAITNVHPPPATPSEIQIDHASDVI